MSEPLIQLKDISFSYAGEPTLAGISLEITENEFVAIIGPSGCGKDTSAPCERSARSDKWRNPRFRKAGDETGA